MFYLSNSYYMNMIHHAQTLRIIKFTNIISEICFITKDDNTLGQEQTFSIKKTFSIYLGFACRVCHKDSQK